MSIVPRGMSVQEAYRNYADDKFLVNRKYQRKLVWTVNEKQYLIDSILKGLPIPLILLGETQSGKFEIVDGLQRLNAIFSFIENRFDFDGKYFDINQFSRAKQVGEKGVFTINSDVGKRLDPKDCANILDYQLAVTIYPTTTEGEITDIFGRINSGGKQLSPQEKRQAGMMDVFSDVVKKISSEIRGDSSSDLVSLSKMPEISIDSTRENIGYGLKAEEIFWCKNGVLRKAQLRDSEDEEMIADIVASAINGKPIARSRELFDKMYDPTDEEHENLNTKIASYGVDRIINEVKVTFSILNEILENCQTTIISTVSPSSANPVKGAFFALFMALFKLIIEEEKTPDNYKGIITAIKNLQSKMISSAHSATTPDRENNVNLTIGLIQPYFIKKDPPALRSGIGMTIDLENSIRRSKVETSRYECKQGFVNLDSERSINENLYSVVIETICGIANVGPEEDGFIFIGIADKKEDSEKIKSLDGIEPFEINGRFVVGVEREFSIFNFNNAEQYVNKLVEKLRGSQLGDPLKTQILSQIDVINYKGYMVIRIRIPRQRALSKVGDKFYGRENSSTIEVTGGKLLAMNDLFK